MESEVNLQTIQKQLATAKEAVQQLFEKELELAEKLRLLSELNILLDMNGNEDSIS